MPEGGKSPGGSLERDGAGPGVVIRSPSLTIVHGRSCQVLAILAENIAIVLGLMAVRIRFGLQHCEMGTWS